MPGKDLLASFYHQKEEFIQEVARRLEKGELEGGLINEIKRLLEWFEKWLQSEALEKERAAEVPVQSFDEFVERVLAETQRLLAERQIEMNYSFRGQNLGISESWKCVKVFGNKDIYYRIGRTRPRKGPYQGKEIVVIDLVMDGYKKQVFLPLLAIKEELEKKLGTMLEREHPKVEATGKYRFKVILPYDVVRRGEVLLAAQKFADFIALTKPIINQLGIS